MKAGRRRVQEDHIAQMLSVRKPSQDFSKRNHTRLLKLQSDLKRQKETDSLPTHKPFKLSRFRSIGAMVFKEKEEVRQPVRTLSVQPTQFPAVALLPAAKQELYTAKPEWPTAKQVLPTPVVISTRAGIEEEKRVEVADRTTVPHSPAIHHTNHLSAETIRKKRDEEETHCPAGVRLLSKEEQAALYTKLQEEQKQTIIAINKVPLASTTPSIVKRRIDLERHLADLEKSLAVFQRTKVYVQA